MTKVQIIHQLETLIEDAESHRNSDGTLLVCMIVSDDRKG